MRTKSSDAYVSNRAWFRDVIDDENVILCGTSALEFLELFDGYIGEEEIEVYAISAGKYENIHYHLLDSFDEIEYEKHGALRCTTFRQTLNDMLNDQDADLQALSEALSNYFYANGESFSGLQVEPKNEEQFQFLKECAVSYYSGG